MANKHKNRFNLIKSEKLEPQYESLNLTNIDIIMGGK